MLNRRRSWQWPLGLLALVVLAQACGGSSSNTAGPSGGTRITLHFTGLERALLPSTCTGVLEVSAPDMATVRATIPPSGQVTILITPGPARLFVVILTCQKTDGVQTYTDQQVADVIPGQPLDLTFNLRVNDPPKVSVACSPSSILVGQTSSCSCRATDRDPGDVLTFTLTASGGSFSSSGPNGSFSSGSPGTFTITCAVSDGKSTTNATTTMSVEPALGSITVTNTSCCEVGPVTFSGPGAIAQIPSLPPQTSVTRTGVVAGNYVASYCSGSTVSFTVVAGQTTSVTLDVCG